jgi:hypothetical protein
MPSSIITAGDASNGLVVASGNDGAVVIQSGPAGAKVNALSIAASGVVSLTGQIVSASTTNTVTTKIAIVANGVTYYLLASTSGA